MKSYSPSPVFNSPPTEAGIGRTVLRHLVSTTICGRMTAPRWRPHSLCPSNQCGVLSLLCLWWRLWQSIMNTLVNVSKTHENIRAGRMAERSNQNKSHGERKLLNTEAEPQLRHKKSFKSFMLHCSFSKVLRSRCGCGGSSSGLIRTTDRNLTLGWENNCFL